jgi:hypothetical protein
LGLPQVAILALEALRAVPVGEQVANHLLHRRALGDVAVELELLGLQAPLETVDRRAKLAALRKKLLALREQAKAELSGGRDVRDPFDALGRERSRLLGHWMADTASIIDCFTRVRAEIVDPL